MTAQTLTAPATPSVHRSPGARAATWLAVVTTIFIGLMAGFFYAYSCSVMIGLVHTDDATFINAMQAINANVRNFGFGPVFFGSLALGLATSVAAFATRLGGRWYLLAAAVLYAGAFFVTMLVSVPLNEALAAAGPVAQQSDPAAVRAVYESPWTTWNLVRTVLNTAALGVACIGLLRIRRSA